MVGYHINHSQKIDASDRPPIHDLVPTNQTVTWYNQTQVPNWKYISPVYPDMPGVNLGPLAT